MNRGLAKRVVFVGRPEIRYFQARLAREVRQGRIEVHGFCFLTTHFHLLLRSPQADLSNVMRRVLNAFVRWFNRRHRRDGPLFRARFTSHPVQSEMYRHNVMRYIDQNPVSAKLVSSAELYPHGSACYRRQARPPVWFHRGSGGSLGSKLPATKPPSSDATWVIERRLEQYIQGDPLDDLLGAAPTKVRAWMERKTRLADGTRASGCLLSPRALELALSAARETHGGWMVAPSARRKEAWRILHAGMLRDLVGLSTGEVAMALGTARSSVGQALAEHRQLVLADSGYSQRAAQVLSEGLRITYGG